MRKGLFLLLLAMVALGVKADDKVTHDITQLPAKAQSVLKHFNSKVDYIEIEEGLINDAYEVKLSNGAEVDFDRNGDWTGIDCRNMAVPDVLLPKSILSYVKSKYPKLFIERIEKKSRGYEVELSNDLELEFDKSGNFKKIDD